MKPKKRQKLCHHCEGEVDLDVIVCPFCAADLRAERPEQQRFSSPISMAKNPTEQSLYPPAYPEQPQQSTIREAVEQEIDYPEIEIPQPEILNPKIPLSIPFAISGILLFAIGAQLLFLGISFLLFSDHGVLLLQFNANWWPLCLGLSIPLLIYGFRSTKNL